MTTPASKIEQVDTAIPVLLALPDHSAWLKEAMKMAMHRDCVDVAHDAELLAYLLRCRRDASLAEL